MHRRAFLATAGTASLAGCSGLFGSDDDSDDDVADSDGDGVVDAQDYAPQDPEVQEKADLETDDEVHSAGVLEIRQTFLGDLDAGTESSDGADLLFEADTPTDRFLAPEGDCQLAVAGDQPVGREGCAEADLLDERVDVTDALEQYVCAETGEGRYAEFLVVSVEDSPGPVTLAYTTWEN